MCRAPTRTSSTSFWEGAAAKTIRMISCASCRAVMRSATACPAAFPRVCRSGYTCTFSRSTRSVFDGTGGVVGGSIVSDFVNCLLLLSPGFCQHRFEVYGHAALPLALVGCLHER